MCSGEGGSLWAKFDARPSVLLKKAVGASVGSGVSGARFVPTAKRREAASLLTLNFGPIVKKYQSETRSGEQIAVYRRISPPYGVKK